MTTEHSATRKKGIRNKLKLTALKMKFNILLEQNLTKLKK